MQSESELYKNDELEESKQKTRRKQAIDAYYMNELKLMEIKFAMNLPNYREKTKEIVVELYEIFQSLQPIFDQKGEFQLFQQLRDIMQVMGQSILINLNSDRKCESSEPLQITTYKSISGQVQRVHYEQSTKKIERSKNRMGGVSLYNESYESHLQRQSKQKAQENKFKTYRSKEYRDFHSDLLEEQEKAQRDELEYFISRRKKMPKLVFNDHSSEYQDIEFHFAQIERKIASFITNFNVEFHLDQWNFANEESSSQLSKLDKLYKNQSLIRLEEIYKTIINKYQAKLAAASLEKQELMAKINVSKNSVKTQTMDLAQNPFRLKSNLIEMQQKYETYQRLYEQAINRQKTLSLKFNDRNFENENRINELKETIKHKNEQLKHMISKIEFCHESLKLNDRDLVKNFMKLSEKAKKFFVEELKKQDFLPKLGTEKQTERKSRPSATIDRFHFDDNEIQRRSSKFSSIHIPKALLQKQKKKKGDLFSENNLTSQREMNNIRSVKKSQFFDPIRSPLKSRNESLFENVHEKQKKNVSIREFSKNLQSKSKLRSVKSFGDTKYEQTEKCLETITSQQKINPNRKSEKNRIFSVSKISSKSITSVQSKIQEPLSKVSLKAVNFMKPVQSKLFKQKSQHEHQYKSNKKSKTYQECQQENEQKNTQLVSLKQSNLQNSTLKQQFEIKKILRLNNAVNQIEQTKIEEENNGNSDQKLGNGEKNGEKNALRKKTLLKNSETSSKKIVFLADVGKNSESNINSGKLKSRHSINLMKVEEQEQQRRGMKKKRTLYKPSFKNVQQFQCELLNICNEQTQKSIQLSCSKKSLTQKTDMDIPVEITIFARMCNSPTKFLRGTRKIHEQLCKQKNCHHMERYLNYFKKAQNANNTRQFMKLPVESFSKN